MNTGNQTIHGRNYYAKRKNWFQFSLEGERKIEIFSNHEMIINKYYIYNELSYPIN